MLALIEGAVSQGGKMKRGKLCKLSWPHKQTLLSGGLQTPATATEGDSGK